MIIRPPLSRDPASVQSAPALGISQPTHSWLSGQLAQLWNFATEPPPPELFLAATLHDIGYMEQEREPLLQHESGLPYSFQELPCSLHLHVWREGIEQARRLSRYAALLISKHTTHLCERHPMGHHPDEKELVAAYVRRAGREQAQLIEDLEADRFLAPHLTPERINAQQKLVATWDSISLYLCGALGEEEKLTDVPTCSGPLVLAPAGDDPKQLTVSPWPFRVEAVELHWDALVFPRHFEDQTDLDDHFPELPTLRLGATLCRAA